MRALIVLALSVIAGCAVIPPETVELSTLLGQMIETTEISHIVLVNKHFDQWIENADRFMRTEYKPAYISNLRKILKRDDPNFQELTIEQYDKAVDRLMRIRNGWVSEIQKAREELLASIKEYYTNMIYANNEITNFLNSTSKLDKSLIGIFGSRLREKSKELESKLFNGTAKIENMLTDALKAIID